MATLRLVTRSTRTLLRSTPTRPFSLSLRRLNEDGQEEKKNPNTDFSAQNARKNDTADQYSKIQNSKPLNPHLTNTTSTISSQMPSVGKDSPPPELISGVDGEFQPRDSVKENTERMTGGTQDGAGKGVGKEGLQGTGAGSEGKHEGQAHQGLARGKEGKEGEAQEGELGVGELEGASFRVEPLRRTGEDMSTMRARLLCESMPDPLIVAAGANMK